MKIYHDLESNQRRNFRYEFLATTSVSMGLLLILGSIPQIVVLKLFNASEFIATLAGSFHLITNFCVLFIAGILARFNRNRVFISLGLCSGLTLICVSMLPQTPESLYPFLILVFCAILLYQLSENARISLWRVLYPDDKRARITSVFTALYFLVNAFFLYPISRSIENETLPWPHAYGLSGLLILIGYIYISRRRIHDQETLNSEGRVISNPLASLVDGVKVLFEDKAYGYYQVLQMLLGTGNLIVTIPRAVLIDITFEGRLSFTQLAVLNTLVPTVGTFLAIFLWARVVDAIGPVRTRIFSAGSFAVGWIILFFGLYFKILWLVYLSCFIWGVAVASGAVLWKLAHSYFAPPHRDSAYFAIHQGLTGLRGICFGFVGLWMFEWIGAWVCIFAMGLLVVAMFGYQGLDRMQQNDQRSAQVRK